MDEITYDIVCGYGESIATSINNLNTEIPKRVNGRNFQVLSHAHCLQYGGVMQKIKSAQPVIVYCTSALIVIQGNALQVTAPVLEMPH